MFHPAQNTAKASIPLPGGETSQHAALKMLALQWAGGQGMTISAPEVSFPHLRLRVDAAACHPARQVPSRTPVSSLSSVLKAAVIFECKQARSDLIRDNKRHDSAVARLKALEARRRRLEALLCVHLPHLANGETLFPEMDSYRLRESEHKGYQKLVRDIRTARTSLIKGTKFDRLQRYRVANVCYLVVEERLIEKHEAPTGWGLLARCGKELRLIIQPVWHDIGVEKQLLFLQRIAARKTYPASPAPGE
jgi:hypothetical protein